MYLKRVAASKPKALGMVNTQLAIPKLRLRLPPNLNQITYKFTHTGQAGSGESIHESNRLRDNPALFCRCDRAGILVSEARIKEPAGLFSGGQKNPLAGPGHVRLGIQLRHYRDDVDYFHPVHSGNEVDVAPLDVIQTIILTLGNIVIACIAWSHLTLELMSGLPENWSSPGTGFCPCQASMKTLTSSCNSG